MNRRSDVHAIKVVETQRADCATQTDKRKSKKKIQHDRDWIRIFNEKRFLLQNFLFRGLKTLNSMRILLRINWVRQSRK
uniref:Uncharacterized protein n=1 Tax=Magallana gigas TaxID=29159 RepID=K1P146_MAGGI